MLQRLGVANPKRIAKQKSVVQSFTHASACNAPNEKVFLQNNDIALSAIYDAIDVRTFEQIKNIEMAHEAWKKLEESFEGTQAVKGAKAYILKEKFASFKMKEDESVPEMFHRLQVLSMVSKHLEKR